MNNSLIVYEKPKSPVSEAYRVLRTNIQFANVDMPLKALAITSSGPGEGKTTTISNLAITFAQTGSKVLLVDGDLRKPSIHKVYELSNSTGLVNVLAKQVSLSSCIQETFIENLFILTSGPTPPNPSELLQSDSMQKFVADVGELFDVVLIDTPPVCNVTDAAILSSLMDGIILVAASGKVKIENIKRAKDILDKVNANIVGVVLNKLDKNSNRGYYNSYYSYGDNIETTVKKSKRKKNE